MSESKELIVGRAEELWEPSNRRRFLKLLGLGGTVVLLPSVFAACSDDDDVVNPGGGGSAVALNLTNDFGILNYAYALEQLEAAFYSAVLTSTPFGSMSAELREVFTDLRNHEVIHREFFKAALGSNAIGSLSLNTNAVASTLTDTTTILRNAEAFEDLGVAAYNGAGKYLTSADFLTLAGKIVSVEARHAAAIRDIRDALGVTAGAAANTRFAGDDVVVPPGGTFQGLDVKLEPGAVLGRVSATGLVSNTINLTPPTTRSGTPDFGPPSPTP